MSNVRPMPGDACRFFRQGRCLYEERLNPGYHLSWRCLVLTRWEGEYDDFLQRAEAFRLDDAPAARLWEKRFEGLLREGINCPRFVSGGVGEVLGCSLLFGDVCLAALPACEGVCRRFLPRGRKHGTDNDP
jgi:hypothetical protein